MTKALRVDPFIEKFCSRIPADVAETFTDAQLQAIQQVFGPKARSHHPLDLRLSLPLPKQRIYLVLLGGKERRSPQRRQAERKLHPIYKPANLFVLSLLTTLVLASCTSIAYGLLHISLPKASDPHPSGIPWLTSQENCEKTGRSWDQGQCLDYEHSPMF